MTDYYACLGIARSAGAAEIRAAYRKLALQLHPDRHPGDKACEARFKEVAQAYNVLSDERQRAVYDRDTARAAPRPEPWRTTTTVWRTAYPFATTAATAAFGTQVFFTGPIQLGKPIPIDPSLLRPGVTVMVNYPGRQMPGVFLRRKRQ